jgi:hypothetical protein
MIDHTLPLLDGNVRYMQPPPSWPCFRGALSVCDMNLETYLDMSATAHVTNTTTSPEIETAGERSSQAHTDSNMPGSGAVYGKIYSLAEFVSWGESFGAN